MGTDPAVVLKMLYSVKINNIDKLLLFHNRSLSLSGDFETSLALRLVDMQVPVKYFLTRGACCIIDHQLRHEAILVVLTGNDFDLGWINEKAPPV